MSKYLHKFQSDDEFYDFVNSEYDFETPIVTNTASINRTDYTQKAKHNEELTFEALNEGTIYWKRNDVNALSKPIEFKKK